MKQFSIALAFFLALLLAGCGGDDPADFVKYGPQVKDCYDKAMAYAKEGDTSVNKFAEYSAGMTDGQGSVYEAYALASQAAKTCQAANLAISAIKIPDMPTDLENMLENGLSELSTAYYVKSDAFEAVMKFLDTQSPAALQEYKDGISQAEGFTLRGVDKLFEAQIAAGLIKNEE